MTGGDAAPTPGGADASSSMAMRRAEQLVTIALVAAVALPALAAVGSVVVPEIAARAEARGHEALAVLLATGVVVATLWFAAVIWWGPVAATSAERAWVWPADPSGHHAARSRQALLICLAAALVLVVPAPWALVDAVAATGADSAETVVAGTVAWLTVMVVLLLVAGARQRGFRSLVPRWRLERAARHQEAARTGTTLLDPEVVGAYRAADDTGRRRPAPTWCAGRARLLLMARGLRPAARVWAPIAALAVATGVVVGTQAAVGVVVVGQGMASAVLARPLRVWASTPSLRRCWSHRPDLPAALWTAPVAIGLVAAVIASAVLRPSWWGVVALTILPVLVTWRRERTADPSGGALISTSAGAVPVEVVNRLLAGTDVTLLALIVALI